MNDVYAYLKRIKQMVSLLYRERCLLWGGCAQHRLRHPSHNTDPSGYDKGFTAMPLDIMLYKGLACLRDKKNCAVLIEW